MTISPNGVKNYNSNTDCKVKEDQSDPRNCRPIALSSCMCKLFEKIVNDRLVWYLERAGYTNVKQTAFRNNRGATDGLIQFEGDVQTAIANKQHAIIIFFDNNKAYDTAWRRQVLKNVLRSMLVAKFLSHRRIWVRIGSTLLDLQRVPNDIFQGSEFACKCFILPIYSITENLPDYVNTMPYVTYLYIHI